MSDIGGPVGLVFFLVVLATAAVVAVGALVQPLVVLVLRRHRPRPGIEAVLASVGPALAGLVSIGAAVLVEKGGLGRSTLSTLDDVALAWPVVPLGIWIAVSYLLLRTPAEPRGE